MVTSVAGRAELRRMQADVAAVPKHLRKDVVRAIRDAVEPLKKEIPASAGQRMPHRGGYAAILAKATRVLTRVTSARNVTATATVSAKGKHEDRDIATINLGRLRHPVFGNRRVWRTTNVRPRFIDDPFDKAIDRAARGMDEAINNVADDLERGH